MIVTVPDPDPGRCQSFRNGSMGQGGFGNPRRCLDYEGHAGRCTFPSDTPVTSQATSYQLQQMPEPKPWVSPLDEKRRTRGPFQRVKPMPANIGEDD